MAAAAELERTGAGTTIFAQGAEPVAHLRVVRSGAVEIVYDGRVLDLLGEGELFGQASMLSGLPSGFEARAAEDTVCVRIAADAAREPLAAPEGMRFIARSLMGPAADLVVSDRDPAGILRTGRSGALIRGAPPVCEPETAIRDAAQIMVASGSTSVVIDAGDGSLGS